jgi:cobyrinic acid a,c-diamide synthase
MKGLIVAAPRSGAGKTTIALGLMRALARRGVAVQPFKCGPDYIDPAFHAVAAGRPSFNLDCWAMSPPTLAGLAAGPAAGIAPDIAIVEGVMGLFDGAAGEGQASGGRSSRGATADLAALLGWPVVLVLDVTGQAETAAAVAVGCARYRDDVAIAGVILNRVASPRHLSFIAPALEKAGIRLFGALPNHAGLALPERHLGLVQANETADLSRRLDAFADALEATVDVAAVRDHARDAGLVDARQVPGPKPPGQRIALARDRAFSFAYPHLLEAWRAAGAEIVPFSPLADEAPDPRADAVWLPGGYPELHAGTLAAASRFRDGLQRMAKRSTRIHGECGGYMVLGQVLEDAKGVRHAMTGLLALGTSFAKRSLHLGYRRARLLSDGILGAGGTRLFGHEFHYASVVTSVDEPLVECVDAAGAAVKEQGARRGTVSGTFFHLIDVGA